VYIFFFSLAQAHLVWGPELQTWMEQMKPKASKFQACSMHGG
jgi:hypothetical protein